MININMDGVLTLPSLPYQHKDFLPEVSGLYFVVVYTPEPQIFYLGKTGNFLKRWKNHHRQPEINLLDKLGLAVDIHWLELRVTDEILSQWENQLIKDLSPALNDTLTMVIEVNRLENKVASLEEFIVEPVQRLTVLPNLASLPKTVECNHIEIEDTPQLCPHCGSYNIKWLSKNVGRKQCKDCSKTWSIKS